MINGGKSGFNNGALLKPRWSDLSSPIAANARLDTGSGRLDYDFFNGGVNFNSNARYPNEPIVIALQMPHSVVIGDGAVMRPHLHWLQQQSDRPNFLLAYKKINQGDNTVFESDFSNYTFLTPANDKFTYTSGTLLQITEFPEIDISDLTISAQLTMVLFRDSNNTSGLFAGSDPVGSGVVVTYQDQHVLFDSDGSREEFVK